MSSHQCCLQGSLFLKKGRTDDEIEAALAPLLDDWELDFGHELTQGNIEHQEEPHRLNLPLEFWGYGCRNSGELDLVAERLIPLVAKNGYLEMLDFDAGSRDSMVTPLFIGETLRERDAARIDYAIDNCTPWLEGALGADALCSIRDHIRSFEPLGKLPGTT
jgi:hypothetical protein